MNVEIVHTDSGYHGRLKGTNGEPLWWTENYDDPRDADHAIQLLIEFAQGWSDTAQAEYVDETTR